MNRNTLTTVMALSVGDRFYKLTDRNKMVLMKVDAPVKKTEYRTYRHFCKSDSDRWPVAINGDTKVVFLRHQNEKV